MLVYIIIAFLFLLFYTRNGITFFYLSIMLLLLIACFRAQSVGTDYGNYIHSFKNLSYEFSQYEFKDILSYIGIIERNDYNTKQLEPLWLLLNKLIYEVGGSYYNVNVIIVLSTTLIYLKAFSSKKISKNFAIFLFFFLFYYFMVFNTARQSLAVALGLLAFANLDKRNFIVVVLLILIATFIHFTSVFLVFSFLIYILRNKIRFHYLILVFSLIFGKYVSGFVVENFSSNSLYWGYTTIKWSETNILISFINYLLQTLLFYFVTKNNKELLKADLFTNIWFVGLVLQNMFIEFSFFHRLADYFLVAQLISIPTFISIKTFLMPKIKFNTIIAICIIILLFALNLYFNKQGVVPYKFL